jgi:peptide/nickel transport system substrate-binding protein
VLARHTMRRLGFVLLAAAFAAPAATQPAAAAPQEPDKPSVLRVAMTQDIDSLNPFLATLQSSTELGRLNYEFLTAYDAKDQHAIPGLAESWQTSPDKLTWTYKIRRGMKWSDDKPITANDVAFTYNKIMTDEAAGEANGNFVENFRSVTATDKNTLVIKTKSPQANMLALDIPVVPEHIWSKVDVGKYDNDPVNGQVVGSGPFIITDYRPGEYVKLKANKNFWRGRPKVDELRFVNFDNTDGALAALRSGQLDLVNNLTPEQFKSLDGEENIERNKAEGRRFSSIQINPGAATAAGQPIGDGNPALRDVRVRQAIAESIDTKALVSQVYDGFAQTGGATIPPVFADYHWTPDAAQERRVDRAAANKLLDQAGYRKGADGVRSKGGDKLDLRLIARNDRPLDQAAAKFVKDWLGQLGIRVQLRNIDSGQLDDATTAGDYDLAFSGWGVNPDPDYILSIQTCGNRPNADGGGSTSANFFCDPQFDALYHQQLTTFDKPAREQIVKRMQQRIYSQVPELTLVYPNVLEAYRTDTFAGFQRQPDPGGVIMGQNGYWGYYKAMPTDAASATSSINTGLVVTIVIVGLVVIGMIVFLVTRSRRKTAHERA